MRSCLISQCRNKDVDTCHIKTRGSGGTDEPWNLLDLCRQHHTEQHAIGFKNMVKKYPVLGLVLKTKGWQFVDRFGVIKLEHQTEANHVQIQSNSSKPS